MKRYLLSAAVLLITVTGFSQEKKEKNEKPTAAAQAAFKKAYPAATKVKWGKEDADFEVNFMDGKKEMSAVYDAAGALKETEEEITAAQLPAAAATYVKQHYKGSVKEAAKITKANGEVNYEAEVNETDVIFDKDGKFLKEVKEKDDKKD